LPLRDPDANGLHPYFTDCGCRQRSGVDGSAACALAWRHSWRHDTDKRRNSTFSRRRQQHTGPLLPPGFLQGVKQATTRSRVTGRARVGRIDCRPGPASNRRPSCNKLSRRARCSGAVPGVVPGCSCCRLNRWHTTCKGDCTCTGRVHKHAASRPCYGWAGCFRMICCATPWQLAIYE
jgi:hypothetical protein